MEIEDCKLTPLLIIPGEKGEVMHAMKNTDPGFCGFGEAYFSTVAQGCVKGWKKHAKMVLNLTVPVGAIKFVLFDDRRGSSSEGLVQSVVLSPGNYQRLTVGPGVWMAFEGIGEGLNLLLNIGSIPHDPSETESLPLENQLIPGLPFDQIR